MNVEFCRAARRVLVWALPLVAAGATLLGSDSSADSAGLYTVPSVAKIEAQMPASLLTPDTHVVCLARFDPAGVASLQTHRMMCYTSYVPSEPPPPPPPPYAEEVAHMSGGALFASGSGHMVGTFLGCAEYIPAFLAAGVTFELDFAKGGGGATGSMTLTIDTEPPLDCQSGAEATGTATLTALPFDNDEDEDGCLDYYELGENGKVGGLMDPFNPGDCNELMDSSGIYRILQVLDEATSEEDPGSYHHFIADVAEDAGDLTARVYCYVDTPGVPVNPEADPEAGDGLPGDPPPAPYGDVDDVQTELEGTVNGNRVELSGCFEDRDGASPFGHLYVEWVQDDDTGEHRAYLYSQQTLWNCQNHNPTGDPMGYPAETDLHATKVAEPGEKHDSDQDGCPDENELGDNAQQGGLRDPFNHWDYFNPTHDGQNRVDDILAVVNQYFIDKGNPAYTKNTDRTAVVGANPWNLNEPNWQQRNDDILAAVKSYMHDCGSGQLISDDDYLPK